MALDIKTFALVEFIVTKQAIATLLLAAIVFSGLALAQQNQSRQQSKPSKPKSITIGQSLESVSEILKSHGIEFGEGGGEFAQAEDVSHLSFSLDLNHTHAYVLFSKSKQTITGLDIVFVPSRKNQYKGSQSHISATELVLYSDRSYAVHFSKPPTREELEEAEANLPKEEVPKSNFGGPPNSFRTGKQSLQPKQR